VRIITFLTYSVCILLVLLSIISSPFRNHLAQGRVYEQNVSCIKTGLNGNVPGGMLSGSQAFDTINQANILAIELARQAESTLFVLPAIESGSADPTTATALQNRFGLGITNPADLQFIPKLEFEYKQVKDYLDGGYTLYICRDPGCASDDDAFVNPPVEPMSKIIQFICAPTSGIIIIVLRTKQVLYYMKHSTSTGIKLMMKILLKYITPTVLSSSPSMSREYRSIRYSAVPARLLPLAELYREVDSERALAHQNVIPQLMQPVH